MRFTQLAAIIFAIYSAAFIVRGGGGAAEMAILTGIFTLLSAAEEWEELHG